MKTVRKPSLAFSKEHNDIKKQRTPDQLKRLKDLLERKELLKDAKEAIDNEHYNSALCLCDRANSIEKSPRSLTRRALSYMKLKKNAKAISDLKEAIEKQPRFWKPYNLRGIIHYTKKHYNIAKSQFQKAIEINPIAAEPHLNLAYMHYKKKEYALAVAECSKAILLKKNYVEAYEALLKFCKAALKYLNKNKD